MANDIELRKQFNAIFKKEDIELLTQFDEIEKRVKAMKDARNEEVIKFLKDNNLEEYETEEIKLKYVAPYKKHSVDIKRMKAEGIYDVYTTESEVKESCRVTVKYE